MDYLQQVLSSRITFFNEEFENLHFTKKNLQSVLGSLKTKS